MRLTKRSLVLTLTVLFLLATCSIALAAGLPAFTMDGVPQEVGIQDKPYSAFSETDCRACHGINTADLHHMTPTALDTSDATKGCIACHTLTAQNYIATPINRACTSCHSTSWHHTTGAAQSGTCTACHDPAILAEMGTGLGAEQPTYTPSAVTPTPTDCANCHNEFNPDWNPATQSGSPNDADPNGVSHHQAMAPDFQDNRNCAFCHDNVASPITTVPVRICESCHTINTLHTIVGHTSSPDADGVLQPDNNKCIGCHGTYMSTLPTITATTTPSVLSADKTSAKSLDYVVVEGTNFGMYADKASVVLTNGTLTKYAPISSLNDGEIRAMIPTMAAGNYDMFVRVGGKDSNKIGFTVVTPPRISTIAPAIGKSGDELTISGTNLALGASTLTVKFVQGSTVKTATPTLANGTLKVAVPTGMIAGQYMVTVNNAIGSSNAVTFTIGALPKINSALPGQAAIGKTTVLYGSNLSLIGKPVVKIGTYDAIVSSWSATKVYVIVPTMPKGLTTITLNNGYAASNALRFTVK